MSAVRQHCNGSLSPESWATLEQAERTLRAIRQRYETGRNVNSEYVRTYGMQVALGYADMFWISAVIEALEKSITEGAIDAR